MPPPLDRETLKAMKRSDLQRICKDYGIKANLKTEALIDLLIDTTQARPRPTQSVQPQRAPSGRIVSRSVASGSRPRGTSSSSVIIHGTDEEDNASEEERHHSIPPPPSSESEAPPPPRTRRAKETQYKLGMGRPTAVGGSGPRTVTRSTTVAVKGKRARGSKSVKPTEAVIHEEEGALFRRAVPQACPSSARHDLDPPPPAPVPDLEIPPVPTPPMPQEIPESLKEYVATLMLPFQDQLGKMHAELQRRSNEVADMHTLNSQIQLLQSEMETLRSQAAMTSQLQNEVHQLRLLVSSLMRLPGVDISKELAKSLGKACGSDAGMSQGTAADSDPSHGVAGSLTQVDAYPGVSQLLGKRHRDSNDSHSTDLVDAEAQSQHGSEDLARRDSRPSKKKIKLSGDKGPSPSGPSTNALPDMDSQGVNPEAQSDSQPAPATFTIFQGPEEPPESYVDPPPPTTHLSDLLPAGSGTSTLAQTPIFGGGAIPRPAGSDENAPNRMAFNFSFNTSIFHPITSTPYEMAEPALAYPEPPASPSPGVPSGGFIERAGGRIERNDVYHPYGRRHAQSQGQAEGQPQSATSRPASRTASSQVASSQSQFNGAGSSNGTVDSIALMSIPGGLSAIAETSREGSTNGNLSDGADFAQQTRRIPSSSEVGLALGMGATLPLPPETPAPPMKRTMYGTELESDTRFGDFGVEGVATGFWTGLVPRF
ncbi:hypothetical protein BD414DRAFT_409772 [Trametes punicea]|nr:hypothetical protein BD414DRAFT_409772 [Trametes punicea]